MKLATFSYTDTKGKNSSRRLLITGTPSDKMSGIDVTKYNDEAIAEFSAQYDLLHEAFTEQVRKLEETFDMKYNFRQFFESKMTDLEVEDI